MNLNSKLTEIKREMDDLGKQLSAQHTSIFRTLDELRMQGAKPVGLGEPDNDGSGLIGASLLGGGSGSGDSGLEI